jgi:hypothetical protein
VDARQPCLPAYEELGRLNRIRVAGAASEFLQDNLLLLVAADNFVCAFVRHVRVEESVRKAEKICREAVTADVRRLPDQAVALFSQ